MRIRRIALAVATLAAAVPGVVGTPAPAGAAALPVVYLTFDDGPAASTGRLLDVLSGAGAHATFFVVGTAIQGQEAMMRREISEGHAVANHTWDHKELPRLSGEAVRNELTSASDAIERVTGVRPSCFRPPYGATNDTVAATASDLGMRQILWNVDTLDWQLQDLGSIMSHFGQPRDGLVILMHDGGGRSRGATIAATQLLLDKWKGAARFEAMPQCLGSLTEPLATPGSPPVLPMAMSVGLGFTPTAPARLLDTRGTPPLRAGETRVITPAVPADTGAVAVNLTMIDPAAAGYLQAWNCAGEPSTSVVNAGAHAVRAGSATVELAAGSFCVRSSVATHLAIDLSGVFAPAGAPAELSALRTTDTRSGAPIGPRWQRLAMEPPVGVTGWSAVVTMLPLDSVALFVSILPCAAVTEPTMPPPVSAVNGSSPEANLVQAATDGGWCAYASRPAHLIVDLQAAWGVGALHYHPIPPTRVLDTRNGTGWKGKVAELGWYDLGVGVGVGAGVAGTLTVVGPRGGGYASAVPCAASGGRPSAVPPTSEVQFVDGEPASATASIVPGPQVCAVASRRAHLIFDVTGIFA